MMHPGFVSHQGVYPYFQYPQQQQQQQQLPPPPPPPPQLPMVSMPKIVPNQKAVFDTNPQIQQLTNPENEVKYTGTKEDLIKCCEKGEVLIVFSQCGTHLPILCSPQLGGECDFRKDKIYLKSRLIFNGVCVKWVGWLDQTTCSGRGCLVYDESYAAELNGQTQMDVG